MIPNSFIIRNFAILDIYSFIHIYKVFYVLEKHTNIYAEFIEPVKCFGLVHYFKESNSSNS